MRYYLGYCFDLHVVFLKFTVRFYHKSGICPNADAQRMGIGGGSVVFFRRGGCPAGVFFADVCLQYGRGAVFVSPEWKFGAGCAKVGCFAEMSNV